MAKIYYCPYCGQTYNLLIPGCNTCENCFSENVEFMIAEHDNTYYLKISREKYGDLFHSEDILLEEIRQNPLFDIEKSRMTTIKDRQTDLLLNKSSGTDLKPKCPTCGSTNIKRISTSSKVFGAALFGLFSKTAHSQFECQNCHYKW